jgi:hypothetical protein
MFSKTSVNRPFSFAQLADFHKVGVKVISAKALSLTGD